MPRIPLASLTEALGAEGDDTDMVILNGPVYIMTVDGEVSIIFEVSPYKTHGCSDEKLQRYLRKQKIPKIWQ